MPEELAQPTNVDPRAAVLQSLFPQNPQANAGAPSIAGAPAAQPPDLRQTVQAQSEAGLGAFGEREKASMDIGQQIQQELAQRSQVGAREFQPNIVRGKGAGGFLHNLGQALLAIGAATGPGQAVQDVAYSKPRAEYAERSQRIEELQKEQKGIQEPMTAAAGLAYKPIQAEASATKAGAAVTAAKARADAVVAQHQAALERIAAMKDIAGKRNATQLEVTKMRDDMMREITSMKDVTNEDVARILADSAQTLQNTKFAEDPDAWGMIKRAFGVTPAQAPGGAQPVTGQSPLPARKPAVTSTKPAKAAAGAVPKGSIVYDPQGKAHTSDGTHALPKGWSAKKPGA